LEGKNEHHIKHLQSLTHKKGIVLSVGDDIKLQRKWSNPNWGIDYSLNVWDIAQKG
jgi:hypothetical protein